MKMAFGIAAGQPHFFEMVRVSQFFSTFARPSAFAGHDLESGAETFRAKVRRVLDRRRRFGNDLQFMSL